MAELDPVDHVAVEGSSVTPPCRVTRRRQVVMVLTCVGVASLFAISRYQPLSLQVSDMQWGSSSASPTVSASADAVVSGVGLIGVRIIDIQPGVVSRVRVSNAVAARCRVSRDANPPCATTTGGNPLLLTFHPFAIDHGDTATLAESFDLDCRANDAGASTVVGLRVTYHYWWFTRTALLTPASNFPWQDDLCRPSALGS